MKIRVLGQEFDKFVKGRGASGESLLIHLGQPRFVCRIGTDPLVEDFLHLCESGQVLHGIAFMDDPVETPEDFKALMAESEAALRRMPD